MLSYQLRRVPIQCHTVFQSNLLLTPSLQTRSFTLNTVQRDYTTSDRERLNGNSPGYDSYDGGEEEEEEEGGNYGSYEQYEDWVEQGKNKYDRYSQGRS